MTEEQKPPCVRRAFAIGLIGVFAVPTTAGALLGYFLGGAYWLLDLFNHFWAHYALLFLAATVLLALLRSRWLLGLTICMLALSVWQVWPYISMGDQSAGRIQTSPANIELLHFNVNTTGGDPAAVAAYIAGQDADIVFLQEVSPSWMDALEGRVGDYELVIAEPRTDNFGIACYIRAGQTRVTLNRATLVDQTGGLAGVPAVELLLEVENPFGAEFEPRPVSVLSLHTLPPVSRSYAQARDLQMQAAADWARKQGKDAVIIGDLNATPWSKPFTAMIGRGDLINSQAGFGIHTTWPARLPATLGIPIDHCLHGKGLTTTKRRVGDSCGSDHKALHIGLKFRGC